MHLRRAWRSPYLIGISKTPRRPCQKVPENKNYGVRSKTQPLTFNMATVIPPPSKRQKVAAEEKARIQQEIDTIPDDLGNVRVQFIDRTTGGSTGGAIALPLEKASAKNLERLLNSLLDHVHWTLYL